MKLLTFLGVAKYQTTLYTWQGQEYESCFAPAASCAFLNPDTLIVFLTEDAREKIYPQFQEAIPAGVEIQPVPVPLGKDEAELWQIFYQVSTSVLPEEEAAFDITHGLRSFPLLGLLAAAFLRSGLDVHLKAVLYGAYDVGRVVSPGVTPMFDLTPMLALLEWSSAADRFNRTGDARFLASLINAQRKGLAAQADGDRDVLEQVGHLGNLAGALSNISQSLRLIRPEQTMELTAGLSQRVEKARPMLARSAQTQPFSLLLERVEQSYAPLGLAEPLARTNLAASIAKQREIILWYVKREHWVQAITLSREWLVNWFMMQRGILDLKDRGKRERIEGVINAEAYDLKTAQKNKTPFEPLFLGHLPHMKSALDLWNQLIDIRNDVSHAGMREQAKKPDDLIKLIRKTVRALQVLPIEAAE